MRLHQRLPLALILAALVHAGTALAEGPTGIPAPPDEALTETARELFAKGVKAAQAQRWDQCRAAFLAAYAVKPHPQIAGNLSACEVKLGMYRDAAEHVTIFLRAQRPDAPPERRAAADEVLREASAKIAIVRLDVTPSGAEVRLDGRSLGNAPLGLPLFLEPGAHVVEVRQESYVTAKRPVDAQAGSASDLGVALVKVAEPPPPLPPVVVERRPLWPALAAGGVAIVALGAGAGLTVAANAKSNDVTRLQIGASACTAPTASNAAQCATLHSDATSKVTLSNAAASTFLAGGALAVAGAGLGIWAAVGPKTAPVRIVPTGSRDHAAVTVQGVW
jgi:PEGA domain